MGKYIEADKLMAILEYRCDEADNVEAWLAFAMACEDVRDLPDADVVEVRHARWVRGDEMADYPRVPYHPWETYCSCCGEIKEQSHDDFCGNCGAKMDEILT